MREHENRLAKIEQYCDEAEQYQRRLRLRIYGVELTDGKDGKSGEECLKKVQEMFEEDLDVNIPPLAIDKAHRIGPAKKNPNTKKRCRPIIVRFTSCAMHFNG